MENYLYQTASILEKYTEMFLVRFLKMLRSISGIIIVGIVLSISGCARYTHRSLESLAVLQTIAFSPDGKYIAAGRNIFNVVLLYNAKTLEVEKAFKGRESDFWGNRTAKSLSFSPDGNFLAAAGIDDAVVVWDVTSGSEILHLSEIAQPHSLAFSPNGKMLTIAGLDNEILLLDFPTGRKTGLLTGHQGVVNCLAFSHSGRILASGSNDRTIRFWNVTSQDEVALIAGHSGPVTCLSLSSDGQSIAAVAGHDVKLWHTEENAAIEQLGDLKHLQKEEQKTGLVNALEILDLVSSIRYSSAPVSVKFSANNLFFTMMVSKVSFSGDYEIQLFHQNPQKKVNIKGQFFDMEFSPDSKILATAGLGVELWDPLTGERINPHPTKEKSRGE